MATTRRGKTKEIKSLEDLTPDDCNLNAGTERGRYAVETSVEQYGLGRGVCVDRKGKVIAGNTTADVAREKGMKVVVVPTDGNTLVVTQRTDLDLDTDQKARELALADNRSGQLGFRLDVSNFKLLTAQGCDFSRFYKPEELADIASRIGPSDGGADVEAKGGRGGPPTVRFGVNLSPEDHLTVQRALNHVRATSNATDAAQALVRLAQGILGES